MDFQIDCNFETNNAKELLDFLIDGGEIEEAQRDEIIKGWRNLNIEILGCVYERDKNGLITISWTGRKLIFINLKEHTWKNFHGAIRCSKM